TGANVSMSASMDFKNGSNTAKEYEYDANGNMTKDLNKGISAISYNLLNLPRSLSISNTSGSATNTYVYAVDGRKTTTNISGKKTDYCGNMIYENNALKRILIEGGYYEPGSTATNGTYYFYLTDHLGNNRVVANGSGTIVQSNHYYPYGMSFTEGTQTSSQPYKFGGKELDTQKRLNLYDFSARMQDPVVPGFTTPDPLMEKYPWLSPYAYCTNNPLRYIDPTGMEFTDSSWKILLRLVNDILERKKRNAKEVAEKQAKLAAGGLSDKKISKLQKQIECK
uniref:RHS repeat domain-containing protein n=1 Tax=Bacteroides sp. UBA939 TaxID=1946092 RepID=UPI0025B886B5